MADIDVATVVRIALLGLGVAFLVANLRLVAQLLRFLRLRSTARLTWPGSKPPQYGLLLALGVVLAGLVVLAWLARRKLETGRMKVTRVGVPRSRRRARRR